MSNASTPQFEVFISYSRNDNVPQKSGDARGWVTALHEVILADHQRFSTEPLRIFLDTREIRSLDDWRDRILVGLRQSKILLVCLSNNYFQRVACLWEWEEYAKRQVHALMGFESVAPVYFGDVPNRGECLEAAWADAIRYGAVTHVDRPQWEQRWTGWHVEADRCQAIDLRPWFRHGVASLQQAEVRSCLDALGTSLWERIRRARRASSVQGNLRRPNPHFVGRSAELRDLHNNLALGAVGVVTAIHGLGGQGKTELATAYAHGWADCYPAGLWVFDAEGRKEMLPLLGELCAQLPLPLFVSPDETGDERGRRVLSELKRRSVTAQTQDSENRQACLVVLDNVSDAVLLSEPQLANLPCEDWLRVVATTRLGEEMFPSSKRKSLAFVAVDALGDEDAIRLIEDHQPGGRWPKTTVASDAVAARGIARELGGFTLAVESVAIYLGLHPEIRPVEYLARLRTEGASSADCLPGDVDVAAQIQHREKRLRVILDQTLSQLTPPERAALDYSAFLPPDSIPWSWLRALLLAEYPETPAALPGYPDPWLSLHRRLEGLRLLTPGDFPDIARMHRLVGASLRQMISGSRTATLAKLARFVCSISTPFAYGLPIEFFSRAWRLIGESLPLTSLFIQQANLMERASVDLAEKWADLSYQLGDSVLEEWWLNRWIETGSTSHAYAQRRASLMHRQGDTAGACTLLREHIQTCGENFDTSIRLVMYFCQLGHHEEAQEAAAKAESRHAEALSNDPLKRARFLHCKYFLLHELDKNLEAVNACRIIRETYVDNHLTSNSLIGSVNLGDALWAVGRPDEAIDLLQSTLAQGQSSGLAQVENIAAICLANVLSSNGSHEEASKLYAIGLETTNRIGHRWDSLYGQIYQALNDLELKTVSSNVFDSLRGAAADAGFSYLSALTDAHVCIASFTDSADELHLKEAIDRGIQSSYPAVRLYALSAAIRLQFASGHRPDDSQISGWVRALGRVQGIKGRIGVIARTADWLLESEAIPTIETSGVRDWVERYVPHSLADIFKSQYPFPKEDTMQSSNSDASPSALPRKCVRLRACNLDACEAQCCYDGVYLGDGEEDRIKEIVASAPEVFAKLPKAFVVDGSWGEGRVSGRKTAVEPHNFTVPNFPVHFTRTRCVFCADDHKCLLQVLAVQRGLHKWTYKPKACWMFPLRIIEGEPCPPPAADEPDPDCLGEEYPGYGKFVPCGEDRTDADPWDVTLADEIAFWKKSQGR
jgi:tetratricopeptide (TPR) repeat protein